MPCGSLTWRALGNVRGFPPFYLFLGTMMLSALRIRVGHSDSVYSVSIGLIPINRINRIFEVDFHHLNETNFDLVSQES